MAAFAFRRPTRQTYQSNGRGFEDIGERWLDPEDGSDLVIGCTSGQMLSDGIANSYELMQRS